MNWNNGHLSDISDIFRTFIGHMTKAQNLSPKETLVNYKLKKPLINADERRTKIATETQRARSYYFSVFSVPLWQIFSFKNENNINNELVRTETNSIYSNFGG